MKLKATVISILCFLLNFPQITSNALPIAKCPTSVTKSIRVKTPISINNKELKLFITKQYGNTVKDISPTSRKLTGQWWVKGWHECYFTDKNIASGYEGFLSSPNDIGYQSAVSLTKETLSGGKNLLISYYKKNNNWVVVRGGSGP